MDDRCRLYVITATARDGKKSQFAAVARCAAEAKDEARQEYDLSGRTLEVFEYHRRCVFLPPLPADQEAKSPAVRS